MIQNFDDADDDDNEWNDDDDDDGDDDDDNGDDDADDNEFSRNDSCTWALEIGGHLDCQDCPLWIHF